MNVSINRIARRARRLWITETLLVVGILAFGGFALMSDAKLSPAQLFSGVDEFVSR